MLKSVRTATWGVFVALAVLALPSAVRADAISVGDGWHSFSWAGGVGGTMSPGAFTFNAAGPVTVQVTDAYLVGDRFELFENNGGVMTSLGQTSASFGPQPLSPGGTPMSVTNPAAAWAGAFSKGSFNLSAGMHSLVLKTIAVNSSFDSGSAFLSVVDNSNGGVAGGGVGVAEAPEPGTLALAGLGFVGMAVARLRRRKAAAAAA